MDLLETVALKGRPMTIRVLLDAARRSSRGWTRRLAFGAAAAVLVAHIARAQPAYPTRNITLVVPFPPGGSTDILARLIALRLTEAMGRSVIIENRPGAGGSVAAEAFARAAPDGYTLMMGHIGTLAVNPGIYPRLGYDPVRSFQPISMVATVHNVLVVHPRVPARNVGELIAHARAKPGDLNYGSGGNGSAAHIAMALFADMARLDLVHVPYRGTAPAVTDLRAGRIELMMTGAPALLPLIQSGELRALGVSGARRLASLPDIPTIDEAGLPGFEASQWYGIVAPDKIPAPIVDRLNAEIRKAIATPETAEFLTREGADPWSSTPDEFRTHIASEIARWGALIRRANIRAD